MLAQVLGQLLAWAVLGTATPADAPASRGGPPTEDQDARGPRDTAARQCVSYCRNFLAACGDTIAFATGQECETTCAGWQRRDGALACRVAFLEPSSRSCIAAGPASPICQR
jgi:hypothetical protein